MVVLGVSVVFALLLCGFAAGANVRFRDEDRLPMQWWLTGEVTWCAPRPLALAFIPFLAICVLGTCIVLARSVKPRSGQEDLLLPSLIFIGVLFVFIQLLHFWLIERSLRSSGG